MSNTQQSKVVLLGPEGVGKTCMLERLRTGEYNSSMEATIGASFACRTVEMPSGKTVRLNVWDTAGQERFESMLPIYVRNAAVAVICISEPNLDAVKKYYDFVLYHSINTEVYIAITKSDLVLSRRFFDDIKEYAKTIPAKMYFTSSLTGENISEIFTDIAEVVEKIPLQAPRSVLQMDMEDPSERWVRCCW